MSRISLVTPTYQQAATLRETIESVLKQDYRDLELWVMDAGSKDGTVEMLREYEHDPRFHWVSEPDKGQSDAINKGLARCTGEIFNWINSDDYLEPGALSRVAEQFEKNPKADIVSGLTAESAIRRAKPFKQCAPADARDARASMVVGVFASRARSGRQALCVRSAASTRTCTMCSIGTCGCVTSRCTGRGTWCASTTCSRTSGITLRRRQRRHRRAFTTRRRRSSRTCT